MSIYVNGSLQTSRSITGWNGDSAASFFGAYGSANFYSGYLRMYPYALTSSQVSSIYAGG